MKWRFALVTFGLAAMTFGMALQADDSGPKKPDASAQVREDVTLQEQILARQFAEFQQSLLRLKQKLERSPKVEDQEQAKILDRVLQKAKDELISTQFSQLVDFLRDQRFAKLGDIKDAVEKSKSLAEDLRMLLALLREDTRARQLKDERERLADLLKKIDIAIKTQKSVQGQTDLGKTTPKELQNNQGKATKQTEEIARAMDGAKEGANLKGEPKGAGKDPGKNDKGKNEGETGKPASSKDPGKGEGEKSEAKGSKAGKEGQEGDPKSKSGKTGDGSDSKQSGAKGSKEGSEGQQGGAKENKNPDDKKGNEAQAKESGGDEGAKIKTKTKEAEKKETDGDQQAKAKSGQQGSESKQSGAKSSQSGQKEQSGEKKSGQPPQGEAKSGSDSKSQGQPKSGQQDSGQQQAKGSQQPPPSGQQQPKDDIANSKKQVEDANYKQQQAEEKIAKEENKAASEKQGQAIKDLENAKKKLEDLLRQIREEELERLLAALQQRCERMLAMQMAVLHGTEQTDKGIKSNPDKKATRKNEQDSLKLSDDEKEIVREADKAIEMLEAEGSAVAFPEVFQQVREDMLHVQRRLGVVDVAAVTQAIEKDIIDTLKEMIEALKKARQENQQAKQGQPKESQSQPNADQKLLDQIAELKMIRSMQIRVNNRTTTYGQQYEGEQAFQSEIRGELQNLAERQERIVIVTTQIAKGDNR